MIPMEALPQYRSQSVGVSRYGWKPVRLGHGAEEPNHGNPSNEPDQGNGITNDGHEVVAVWTGSGDWKRMHEIGTFQLVGSGATRGMGACSGRLWHS